MIWLADGSSLKWDDEEDRLQHNHSESMNTREVRIAWQCAEAFEILCHRHSAMKKIGHFAKMEACQKYAKVFNENSASGFVGRSFDLFRNCCLAIPESNIWDGLMRFIDRESFDADDAKEMVLAALFSGEGEGEFERAYGESGGSQDVGERLASLFEAASQGIVVWRSVIANEMNGEGATSFDKEFCSWILDSEVSCKHWLTTVILTLCLHRNEVTPDDLRSEVAGVGKTETAQDRMLLGIVNRDRTEVIENVFEATGDLTATVHLIDRKSVV